MLLLLIVVVRVIRVYIDLFDHLRKHFWLDFSDMTLKLERLTTDLLHKKPNNDSEHRKVLLTLIDILLYRIFIIRCEIQVRKEHKEPVELQWGVRQPQNIISPNLLVRASNLVFQVV